MNDISQSVDGSSSDFTTNNKLMKLEEARYLDHGFFGRLLQLRSFHVIQYMLDDALKERPSELTDQQKLSFAVVEQMLKCTRLDEVRVLAYEQIGNVQLAAVIRQYLRNRYGQEPPKF